MKVEERLFSVEEVAERLGMSKWSITDWLKVGRLKGAKIGKFWRVKESDLQAFLANPPPFDVSASIILRIRMDFGEEPDIEFESFCDDERSAIIKGKKAWPRMCENAITSGWKARLTVIDRQKSVCWEREAPIRLERDRTLGDEAWVLYVLRHYGPLTTPQLTTVAGVKPAAVKAKLKTLEAQGLIRRCGEFDSNAPGRRAVLWDAVVRLHARKLESSCPACPISAGMATGEFPLGP
jgi:excisionase family DNA binding protein